MQLRICTVLDNGMQTNMQKVCFIRLHISITSTDASTNKRGYTSKIIASWAELSMHAMNST